MRAKLILCAGLVAAAACGRAPMRAGVDPAPSPTVSPTPSESPSPAARRLLYATKTAKKVTVKTIDLETRAERTLFVYEERQAAEHSGNYWEELSPAVAYSAAADMVAYGADDGLHVYDMRTGAVTTLVRRVAEGRDEAAPTWSPAMEDTYGISNVRWSGDGRYVSFDQPHYEGNTTAFFDRETGRLFLQKNMPFSYADPSLSTPAWAAQGASTVASVSGSKPGIFLSDRDDPSRGTLVPVSRKHFGVAALSPDASLAAFLFSDVEDDYENRPGLGIIRRDGTGLRAIDTSGHKSSVLIDSAEQVWWTEGGTVWRWTGTSKTMAGRVDASYVWHVLAADEKTVSLSGHAAKHKRGLFVLLERGTGKALAVHGVGTDYVTFLGLI